MDRPSVAPVRYLIMPMTIIGLLLFVHPLIEVGLALRPLRLDLVRWRFGAEGLMSGATVNMCMGLLLLLGSGILKGSHRRVRASAWVAILSAAAILVLMVIFALDGIQVLAMSPGSQRLMVKHGTTSGVVRDLFTSACMIGLAISARRYLKETPVVRKAAVGESLLVRAPAAAPPAAPSSAAKTAAP